VLVSPSAELNPNLPSSWRASPSLTGSPGGPDASGGGFGDWMAANGFNDPGAEYNQAGFSNLLAYAIGADLEGNSQDALPAPGVIGIGADTYASFSYQVRADAPGVIYEVQSSTTLDNWISAAANSVQVSSTANPDGTKSIVIRSVTPVAGQEAMLFRLKVTAP
jgi:hypothetical protein